MELIETLTKSRTAAFSGILYAGKDFAADAAGIDKIGFADPMYEVTKYYCGTDDKAVPGIRRFMQKLGQWGWGRIDLDDPDYAWSMERATFIQQLKQDAAWGKFGEFTEGMCNWSKFGEVKSFWVDILEYRWRLRHDAQQWQAIVNIRFEHERELLDRHHIPHFLVDCHPDTQAKRAAEKGATLTAVELNDVSEQLAAELRERLPANQIIWNDDDHPKPHEDNLSVGEFVELINRCQQTKSSTP